MLKKLLFLLLLLITPGAANAACPSPYTMKEASSVTQNVAAINDASNNCVFEGAAALAVSYSGTLQSAASANGNGTALSVTGTASAAITVNCSSCSGGTTINFEGQEDGSNFRPIMATLADGTAQGITTSTSGFTLWQVSTTGLQQIRARISAYSAGTVTITAHAFAVPTTLPPTTVYQGGSPWGSNVTQLGSTTLVTGGVNGSLGTGGLAASGATQAGNPLKAGGVFNTTQPTVTNGQAVDAQATARGAYIVATGIDAFTVQPGNTANTTAWKVDNSAVTQPVQYANVDVTALASAGRTTTQTVTNLLNKVGRGIRVTLDMTTVGTGSVTLTINAKDAVSGKTKLLLAGAAVTTNVTNVYIVYPGYAAVANVSANDVLSATFELVVTANNANTAIYSLGYCILL